MGWIIFIGFMLILNDYVLIGSITLLLGVFGYFSQQFNDDEYEDEEEL